MSVAKVAKAYTQLLKARKHIEVVLDELELDNATRKRLEKAIVGYTRANIDHSIAMNLFHNGVK